MDFLIKLKGELLGFLLFDHTPILIKDQAIKVDCFLQWYVWIKISTNG